MKKLAVLTSLLFILTFTLNAQERQKRMRKGAEFTTEQKATLHSKKMTLALDLNENQQKEVYKLMKEASIEREAKMNKFKENKANGVELSTQEKFDLENEKLNRQIAHKAAMKKILNTNQYEKWEKQLQKRGKQHRKGSTPQKQRKGKKGKKA